MQPIDYACGAAMCVRREVFEQVGLLDARFFLIWEESDFCFQAKRSGFLTMTCPQAKVWHKVSASFAGKAHSTYFWWRNRLLWIEKNCPFKERILLYVKILIPEILHLYKMNGLKTLQLLFNKTDEKRERLVKIRAALRGVEHYLLRRFGNGPNWIYKKPYSQSQKTAISQINPD
jgi:GT2 family glycosyltransferase